ncbi:MAG: BtpA/SgcQ family protein [Acidimicrobiia bacterium]|nr:BtpA/SgcQ family protein [Acidimicrobiia bacterium]
MSAIPHLVGMVHLVPLPGSPRYGGSMDVVLERAVADAVVLTQAGFPAVMIENFGDAPFHAGPVPPETVAAMTLAVGAVADATSATLGVNVLRNDAMAALGIAAATGARFIRVNVLTGLMYTDQGPIVGDAAALLRRRALLAPDVEVWADVMVKHATAPPGLTIAQAASDILERGMADALIVSGTGTGSEPVQGDVIAVQSAVPPGTRLVIGSGATVDNLGRLSELADSVIVGSSLKRDSDPTGNVDPDKASHFVKVAEELGLT